MTGPRAALLPALALLAACADPYRSGESWSHNYPPLAEQATSRRTDRKEILHWAKNPKDKVRIGYVEQYTTQSKGSRDWRISWYITDRTGSRKIGFITAEGVYQRFVNGADTAEVGKYDVPPKVTGLKVFFGIPLAENVDLEEVDPYR
jgi:hypothetical protein